MNHCEAPGVRKGPLQQGKVRVRRTRRAQVGILGKARWERRGPGERKRQRIVFMKIPNHRRVMDKDSASAPTFPNTAPVPTRGASPITVDPMTGLSTP